MVNHVDCSICIEPVSLSSNEATALDCSHIFHNSCILPWLENNNTCPNCRAHVIRPYENPPPQNSSKVVKTLAKVIAAITYLFFAAISIFSIASRAHDSRRELFLSEAIIIHGIVESFHPFIESSFHLIDSY